MPKNASFGIGALGAGILGVAIVGALAATPFYLGRFAAEPQRLDQTLDDEITIVRRIVQNIDEHLSSMADLAASLGDEVRLDRDTVARVLERNPDLISRSTLAEFKRALQRLRDLDRADQQHGTRMDAGGRLPTAPPDFQTAAYKMENVLLTEHINLQQKADKVLRDMQTARVDGLGADRHLGANRIRAILLFVQGRLERNRAEFEQWEGAQLRRHASSLVDALARCRLDAAAADARRPTRTLAELDAQIARVEAAISQHKGVIAGATQTIAATRERVEMLEAAAREARTRLRELETSGAAIHDESSEYGALADRAREAEAAAAALRNGTLAGTRLVEADAEDLLAARYEGGERQPGLRDYEHALELSRDLLAGLEATREGLLERKAAGAALDRELKEKSQSARRDADTQQASISELLDEAARHLAEADRATASAMRFFDQADRAAKAAIRAASARVREARSATASAGGPEAERLRMIAGDGDMEAAMHTLVAEIAYNAALLAADRIDAHVARFETENYIAWMTGRDPVEPPAAEVEAFRSAAINRLAGAKKAYEQAQRLVSRTQAASPKGKILGRNYVWQVQVGLAAVHLLHASLSADAADARSEETAAYNLLTEAARGREQSPLLSPAIEAILELQQNQ